MRKIIFTIIWAMVIINSMTLIATDITKELNSLRVNDNMELSQINIPKGKLYNDTSIYDFSNYEITGSYIRKISKYGDSLISVYENKMVNIYDIRRNKDSLVLCSFRQPGMNLKYILPEVMMKYPFYYGNEISGYFYSEGKLGTMGYLRHSGRYNITANGRGRLITPDGDTIQNVLMTTYHRYGSTIEASNFEHSFSRTADSTLISPDSINHRLNTDSITHRIYQQCWYAQGFRYPIIDIRHHKVYYYGIQTDSYTIALYHSPMAQKYDLASDPENDIIRQNEYFNQNGTPVQYSTNNISGTMRGNNIENFTHNSLSSNPNSKSRINDKADHNTANYSSNINNNQYNDISQEFRSDNYCSVSPTVVTTSTLIKWQTSKDATISAVLLNAAGSKMWSFDNEYSAGEHSISCDMSSFINGNYVIYITINNKIYSYKLIKQ